MPSADAGRSDRILRQITSNPFSDPLAIELGESAFSQGALQRISYARPGKLFTANDSLFSTQAGALQIAVFLLVRDAVVAILRGNGA